MKLFIDDAKFRELRDMSPAAQLAFLSVIEAQLDYPREWDARRQTVMLENCDCGDGSGYAELMDRGAIRYVEHVQDESDEYDVIDLNPYWVVTYMRDFGDVYRSSW